MRMIDKEFQDFLKKKFPEIPDPAPPEFVKYVRRNLLDTSQADFALLLGCAKQTVSNWENGRTLCTGVYTRLVYLLMTYPGLVPFLEEKAQK